MKRFALLALIAVSLGSVAHAAAKDKKAPPAKAAAGKLDLGPGGLDATIEAPAGAVAKESAAGGAEVTAGNKFQLQISKTSSDIASWKKDIAANDVNKLKKYHVEKADELLYETAVAGPEFHLVAIVKVGADNYSCEDVKGDTFSKADAEAMLKACHTLAKK